MPQFPALPSIDATVQIQTVTFDFGPLVQANYPPGTYINPGVTPAITCTTVAGSDPDPSSRLIGTPQIGTAPQPYGSGLVNCAVLQQVGDCLGGTTYLLQCVVTLSSGDVESLWGHLPCVTPQ